MLACTPGAAVNEFAETYLSLQRCGEEEAKRFKWIQSEKEGRDLGDQAIRMWIHRHWNGFLRHRWLEHLQGKSLWIELEVEDFGLLQREFRNSPLIDPILERLKALKENLDIIVWAQDSRSQKEVEEVLRILEVLDVNSSRIQCDFDPRKHVASGGAAVA
jgi:hypothetical protein